MTIKASELETIKQKERQKGLGCGIATAFRASGESLEGKVWLGNAKTSARFCRRIVGSI